MAFIYSTLYSKTLAQNMHLDLFLPNDLSDKKIRKPRGLIYFLHGLSSSEREFREYTAVNRYARENNLAVAFVSAPFGFYTDMKYGFKYFTYLTEELPALLKSLYNLSFSREKTMVAGLSMGGYGALKLGLTRPDIYGVIAAFSGAVDLLGMKESLKDTQDLNTIAERDSVFVPVFGEELDIKNEDDLFYLANKVAKLEKEKQPRIFTACGKQDDLYFLYDQNIKFKEHLNTLDLKEFKYMEWDGVHDYSFWDRAMMHAVGFFMQNKYDEKKIKLWL